PRVLDDFDHTARYIVRLIARALIVEDADVARPLAGVGPVEPAAERILVDDLRRLELRDVEVWICRGARENDRAGRQEPGLKRGDRRHGSRPRGRTRDGLNEVDPRIQTVPLIAAEEKTAVLDDRASERPAKLVLVQLRFRERRLNRSVGRTCVI